MQISIKYVFSYLLFKYYTDAVRPLFVTEFRFSLREVNENDWMDKEMTKNGYLLFSLCH